MGHRFHAASDVRHLLRYIFSPHTRGSPRHSWPSKQFPAGFPAPAGVVLNGSPISSGCCRLSPHTRGSSGGRYEQPLAAPISLRTQGSRGSFRAPLPWHQPADRPPLPPRRCIAQRWTRTCNQTLRSRLTHKRRSLISTRHSTPSRPMTSRTYLTRLSTETSARDCGCADVCAKAASPAQSGLVATSWESGEQRPQLRPGFFVAIAAMPNSALPPA
jgi:hypothetical protein